MEYNGPDSDWIEFGLGLAIGLAVILLTGILRFASAEVLRVDIDRTLLHSGADVDSHVIIGEYRLLSLLGAPHVVRTRSALGFAALLAVVVGTTALAIAPSAFSGSRKLKTSNETVKITARPGDSVMDEDKIEKFADWFRSSGVVSFCQRREGEHRAYFQPFVEPASNTRLYCGAKLNVQIRHESEETIESVNPSTLRLAELGDTKLSTPHSKYIAHDITIDGKGLLAVCNTGPFYRGIRRGRISQHCAFTTKTTLILGGYVTTQTGMRGPGQTPIASDIEYFDSYSVDLGVELNRAQLMQALTLWDLGAMSEVEVAVLSTLRLEFVGEVASFSGGFVRLQIDVKLLVVALSFGFAMVLWMAFVLMWDGFTRTKEERFRMDLSTVHSVSRIMRAEANGIVNDDEPDAPLNRLAVRDVTNCACNQSSKHVEACTVERQYHVGSASIGRPTDQTSSNFLASLHRDHDKLGQGRRFIRPELNVMGPAPSRSPSSERAVH